MEKKKTTKKVAAEKPAAPTPEKPTYEQLENYAKQLSIQAQRMASRIQDLEAVLDSKRIDYLFKVVENPLSFSEDFVKRCADEITATFTIVQDDSQQESK